jgi:hypothetical protein
MRYASVEDYLKRLKESTTYTSKDFCRAASRWISMESTICWCRFLEDTEGGSLISQSNTLVEVI